MKTNITVKTADKIFLCVTNNFKSSEHIKFTNFDSKMNIRPVFRFNQLIIRSFSNAPSKSGATGAKATAKSSNQPSLNVTGLSERCVKSNTGPVGPGASSKGDYKVPEYFCYDKTSYAEAEIEMAKFRCPQPSAH